MNENSSDVVLSHVEKCFGPVHNVLHEFSSEQPIDVFIFKATEEMPYHVLVTSGMSDLPMHIPENADVPLYIELMVVLPSDWQLPKPYEIIGDNKQSKRDWQWPLHLLRDLARFPQSYHTWLGFGHTIPNGDPAIPFSNDTMLCGTIILPSCYMPMEFRELSVNENKTIHFFSVVPLYQEEMALKMEHGTDALLTLFNQNDINDLLVVDRVNVAIDTIV